MCAHRMPALLLHPTAHTTSGFGEVAARTGLTLTDAVTVTGGGWVLGAAALLHVISLVANVVVVVMTGSKELHTDPSNGGSVLLASGAVPGQLVLFAIAPCLYAALFALLSAVDAAYFLATNWMLTGSAFGFGLMACASSAAMMGIAAWALDGVVYAVCSVALLASALALGANLGLLLELLIKGNSTLLARVRAAQ